MNLKSLHIIFFILSFGSAVSGQNTRIGLFYDQLVESFVFHCMEGSYSIIGDGQIIGNLDAGQLLYINLEEGKIILRDGLDITSGFSHVEFSDPSMKSEFSLKLVIPSLLPQNYEGELEVNIRHGMFQLVNKLEFDHYLAGVVETEGGPAAGEEYFKAQAVLCRTYAVKNWERHIEEGFNLCDDVHCQAYKGKNDENPAILQAVYSTHDIVVADFSYKLITAAYHSNSGGQTQKADGFWPGKHEYLLSILDPFSETGRNFSWKDSIDWNVWKEYFRSRGVKLKETDTTKLLIRQPHRKEYMVLGEDTIRLADIRTDFNLRSAFFDARLEGNRIVLDGRGYGHGVGMSQEGAMEMAEEGYTYRDILNYYFNNIRIYDLNDLPFNSVPEIFR